MKVSRKESLMKKLRMEMSERLEVARHETTRVDLHDCELHLKPIDELISLFEQLSPSVVEVDLSGNKWTALNPTDFERVLKALPRSVRSLNLYSCFSTALDVPLDPFLSCIPDHVTSLNLSGNRLGDKRRKPDDVVEAMKAIPRHMVELHLADNELHELVVYNPDSGQFEDKWLIDVLSALPPFIINLNLTRNGLYGLFYETVLNVFRALPQHVTRLNFKDSWNAYRTRAEQAAILRALHSNVRELSFFREEEPDEFVFLMQHAPHIEFYNVSYLHYDKKYHIATHLLETYLSRIIESKSFDFSLFERLPPILESHLVNGIALLEKENTPRSFLMCGLLLEGRVHQVLEEEKNEDYFEKRCHDAIGFYLKAATDVQLKPYADLFLWEMKMHAPFPSIEDRLAEFNVRLPRGYIDSYEKFGHEEAVNRLPVEHLFFSPNRFMQLDAQDKIHPTPGSV